MKTFITLVFFFIYMMLSTEQLKEVKKQIVSQIESWPEPQRASAINKINSMSDEDLETFLIQNNLLKIPESQQTQIRSPFEQKISEQTDIQPSIPIETPQTQEQQQNKPVFSSTISPQQSCVFCMISQNKIKSLKIEETNDAVAVLEINPVSQGHVIVIPKQHVSDIDSLKPEILEFAIRLTKKLKLALRAEYVELFTNSKLSHITLNLVPITQKELPDFPRQKSEKQDLENTYNQIMSTQVKYSEFIQPSIPLPPKQPSFHQKKEDLPRFPSRIP